MAKLIKKSVAPIYAAAAVWAVWGMFLPLYRMSHFILAAVCSVVVWLIARRLWPDKVVTVADPPRPEKDESSDPETAALLAERERALSEMHRLNDSIADPVISAHIDHLEEVTGKILDHVAEHPEKRGQIRRFLSYYLPTTLKLLNAYDRMDETGVSGVNIDGTKGRIAEMMDTISAAFDKQLDALFGGEALDISTDITVLEQMLAREGIGGMQFPGEREQ